MLATKVFIFYALISLYGEKPFCQIKAKKNAAICKDYNAS